MDLVHQVTDNNCLVLLHSNWQDYELHTPIQGIALEEAQALIIKDLGMYERVKKLNLVASDIQLFYDMQFKKRVKSIVPRTEIIYAKLSVTFSGFLFRTFLTNCR